MTKLNYLPKVKEQYEELPYPQRNPEDDRVRIIAPFLSSLDAIAHHCYGGIRHFQNFRFLIVGGGTGDDTIWLAEQLRDIQGATVSYLDMSAASMDIARKRAEARGLKNISWINDSLLNIPKLGLGKFDYIQCSGVLHHLKDPDEGLKAVASVLKPEGRMNIMVYAKYGRAPIYMVQEVMRLINATESHIGNKLDNAKKTLSALADKHWYNVSKEMSIDYPDALNDAGIYDMFLHSQDRAYTILDVHDWLERCDLKMTSAPGVSYGQIHYKPETYIKDKEMLKRIKAQPIKIQQAIAEGLCGRVSKHEFYTIPKAAEDHVATVDNVDLIPCRSIATYIQIQQIADIAKDRTDDFSVDIDNKYETRIFVPMVKHRYDILSAIDDKKSIRDIMSSIDGNKKEFFESFKKLFDQMNMGHMLYLKHPNSQELKRIDQM